MSNFVRRQPSYLLRRLFSIGLVLAFTACATGEKGRTDQVGPGSGETPASGTGIIKFTNKTPFIVHLVRGSGRTDVATIAPGASENVPNDFANAETYYPLYDIPLTSSYSLPRLRPEDPNFYYQADASMERQEIELHVPGLLGEASAYIIFTNSGSSGGVSLSRNDSNNRMTGINFADAKDNINRGETMVYRENPRDLRSLRINPSGVRFGEMEYRSGFIYTFDFNGSNVSLIDARPLQRAGEDAWAVTMSNAVSPIQPVAGDGEIHMLVSEKNGLARYSFDSAGNGRAPVQSGENLEVTAAIYAGGSFFIAGYDIEGSLNRPIARIQGADGNVQRLLSPSPRSEYESAYFSAAAHKNGAWLVAGGASRRGVAQAGAFPAYVRLVQDNNAALTAGWEIGRTEFDTALKRLNPQAASSGAVCGEVRSAVYDSAHDRYILTGVFLEFDSMKNPLTCSYIAVLNSAGDIQKIDTSFRGMSFYRLLLDSSGNYYAVGEEERGNESYAVIVKYDTNGRQLWRSVTQPASHSYYQDAILDEENSQVVLVGTVGATDESGFGGSPLIEGVSIANGRVLWTEKLTDRVFAGASLVTAIIPAPDYGFAITLSGIAGGDYAKPFIIARVNSYGKFLK